MSLSLVFMTQMTLDTHTIYRHELVQVDLKLGMFVLYYTTSAPYLCAHEQSCFHTPLLSVLQLLLMRTRAVCSAWTASHGGSLHFDPLVLLKNVHLS